MKIETKIKLKLKRKLKQKFEVKLMKNNYVTASTYNNVKKNTLIFESALKRGEKKIDKAIFELKVFLHI